MWRLACAAARGEGVIDRRVSCPADRRSSSDQVRGQASPADSLEDRSMGRYTFVPPGGGANYDWTRDHTFVKVASADTGGAFALMEDNLKREFALGLHLHRQHAETFYILDGRVDFFIAGDWMT